MGDYIPYKVIDVISNPFPITSKFCQQKGAVMGAVPHNMGMVISLSLKWRHNGRDSVSNHQPHDCLLNHLFRRRSKKTSKLRVTGLCAGNSPGTGEFPAQMASYAENVSIWWRHHDQDRRSQWLGVNYIRSLILAVITYPYPNFNGSKFRAWMSNCIP